MKVTCPECKTEYDDAERWTNCPHDMLMEKRFLEQKDAGAALLGKVVRLANQEPGSAKYRIFSVRKYRVFAMRWDGRVSLNGIEGYFSPHWFVVDEE